MRRAIEMATPVILACILVLGVLIYRQVDRASDAVVDTTSTAVAAIDALAGDELRGATGLSMDQSDPPGQGGQWIEAPDGSLWPLDLAPEEEPIAEEGTPDLPDSFEPLDDYPVGGWILPELHDELGGLCHDVNRALEGEFDDLALTDARAYSFGLMIELCDLYWADEIAARDR